MAEHSEDRRSDLRSQPHNRRQNQRRGSQIPSLPTSRRQRPTTLDLRCQRMFRAQISLVGYLRTNCSIRATPSAVFLSNSASSSMPTTNNDRPPELPLSSSSTIASTSATAALVTTTAAHNPDTSEHQPSTHNASDVESIHACAHCDHTFTSHIGLVGHLQIYRTETGEPVPGAPTNFFQTLGIFELCTTL
nr:unnamed protein product [Spirometra erinaceieuropaei]